MNTRKQVNATKNYKVNEITTSNDDGRMSEIVITVFGLDGTMYLHAYTFSEGMAEIKKLLFELNVIEEK